MLDDVCCRASITLGFNDYSKLNEQGWTQDSILEAAERVTWEGIYSYLYKSPWPNGVDKTAMYYPCVVWSHRKAPQAGSQPAPPGSLAVSLLAQRIPGKWLTKIVTG